MIITLTGNNSFAIRQRLNELTCDFVSKYGELALEKFDGEEDEAVAIIEGLQSLPFLAQQKLVVVRSGGLNKELAEHVEQIISSIGETTNAVFYEPQVDKRTAYFKVLKNQTMFEEFNELDHQSLAKWLVDQTNFQGATLERGDANYLIERVGTNQTLLVNELNKLLTYKLEVTRASIDLLTEPTSHSKVFDLLDMAFSGNKKRALKLYDEQRAQKVEPQLIIGMIAWQLQLIALAKNAGKRTPSQIAADSGMKAYPIEKARGLASRLSNDGLKNLVTEALSIDYKSKTTPLDLDEALKNYIVVTL